MRGGELIVRDGCGWRGGINMKQYGGKCPVIVVGGDAGNFLGALLARYDACFGTEPHEHASVDEFVALRPASSRPYATMYAS